MSYQKKEGWVTIRLLLNPPSFFGMTMTWQDFKKLGTFSCDATNIINTNIIKITNLGIPSNYPWEHVPCESVYMMLQM